MALPLVYLMYHELELPGRELCQRGSGYTRYVLEKDEFGGHLGLLAQHGYRGLSVSQALLGVPNRTRPDAGSYEEPARPAVVFTFDDGTETDLIAAAPLLKESGFGATFFLVAGFLGQRGYLTHDQARELARLGFEIGCHSMTHAYLTALSATQLSVEVADAKNRLEQILDRRVDHFSCPGGRWSPLVGRAAREAGYRSVCTSRIGANAADSDRYALNRVAVLRRMPGFMEICQGRGLGIMRLKQSMRSAVRSAVGDSRYEKVRDVLLR